MSQPAPAASRVIDAAARAFQGGDAARAKAILVEGLRASPRDGDLLRTLARVHALLGEQAAGADVLRRAAGAYPDDAALQRDAADALVLAGAPDDALAILDRAPAHDALAFECRARAMLALDRPEGVRAALEGMTRAAPDAPGAHCRAGAMHAQLGQAPEGVALLRRALGRLPDDPDILETLCYVMNFDPATDAAEHAALHRRLGEVVTAMGPGAILPFANTRDPERPLRVGFVSGDLRFHACAFFLAGLVASLDPARAQPILYANNEPDETTANLASIAPLREIRTLRDDDLEDLVRADGVDVLVDCNGWTGEHRLRAFARRLAPVQCTYLGYPNTTGLPAMDARLVDAVTDPPGAEAQCSERVVRLPGCFLSYAVMPDVPEPAPSAYLRGHAGAPTFACFNRVAKTNPRVLGLWARVLASLPGARLLMKTEPTPGLDALVRRAWTNAGGTPAALVFTPFEPDPRAHLAAYHHADVSLDPFPYAGTTSTVESLLMGVPVVTRDGGTHRSRVGASLLGSAGLADLVAPDDATYVARAAALAQDRARLASLRRTLRDAVRHGPIGDHAAHARGFEGALRDLWRAWCGRAGPGAARAWGQGA
ncbi:MAG: hypothetical protein SFY69_08715 [Planctomycetota bacterium]|nr:hypothetical protein [Planctomycetota bacterium]